MDDKDDTYSTKRYKIEPTTQSLRGLVELSNLAEHLEDEELNEIGAKAKKGYEYDLASRSQWERDIDEWLRLATQVREPKSYPWPRASNVKYPLLATAAMQFAARAYPSLVPSNGRVVTSEIIGKDQDGTLLEQATRVDTFMSYQIMHEMQGWEEDMDKLLIMLPVVGTIFKKTYWDPIYKQNCSRLVMPKNLVVNYWTECLETSERISERIEMSARIVEGRMRSGLFLDKKLASPNQPSVNFGASPVSTSFLPSAVDETTPYVIIEQHTYLDLDKDGYEEPYIVTFDLDSGEVLRISARFDDDTMYFNDKQQLLKIDPIQYYTKFGFIPNPDGSFYDIGFGMLLGPLNESVNTVINQLIDAGTLSTLQGGFLGKGLRVKLGETRFQPGEWKPVNATGDDLRKQIIPLPAKEPSPVLFQLMGSMISSGKELASIAEIFTGKMPGQNTPATTTMATIDQGMKVFTAIYKRIYRALDSEFKKLFALNATYLNPDTYQAITGINVGPQDFKPVDGKLSFRIFPGADPTASSLTEKLTKAQGLMEMMPIGTLDPVEVTRRMLDAQEQPSPDKLLNRAIQQTGQMPPPPPDPKLQEMQMAQQFKGAQIQMEGQKQQSDLALKQQDQQAQIAMKAQQQAQDQQNAAVMTNMHAAAELHTQKVRSAQEQAAMVQQAELHRQTLAQNAETHRQKLQQQREAHVQKMKQQPPKKKE